MVSVPITQYLTANYQEIPLSDLVSGSGHVLPSRTSQIGEPGSSVMFEEL